ncbi:MAG: AI-2E family transporter [Acidobacteria bacterium]|nr:MAG: AI-2E family transporter [Acidobacteriota bacterium]
MSLELSPRQRLTVASALTVLAGLVLVLTVGAVLFLLGLFFTTFSNVFLPLAVAGAIALVFKPYYDWLQRRLRLPPPAAVAAFFVSLLIPVAALGWFFGSIVVSQVSDLIDSLPAFWEKVNALAQEHLPKARAFWDEHALGERLRDAVESRWQEILSEVGRAGGFALSAGAGALRGLAGLFAWAVLPVYLTFFLMARPPALDSRDLLPFLKSETRDDVIYLAREFVEIIVAFFRGQLLIALLQGALFAVGFSLVGLRFGLVLGLTLGFLNVVPYLGNIVGLAVAVPLALFQQGGGLLTLGLVLAVFTAVQMIEGYVLTPRIMGEQTGLHPMAIIIAIFFWGSALGGISGMILAIPLTAFLASFWRLAKEKYIPELV